MKPSGWQSTAKPAVSRSLTPTQHAATVRSSLKSTALISPERKDKSTPETLISSTGKIFFEGGTTQSFSTGRQKSVSTKTSHFQSYPSGAAGKTTPETQSSSVSLSSPHPKRPNFQSYPWGAADHTTIIQSSFSSTSSPQQKNQSGDNTGIIIGSVTGAVVAIVIIVVAVLVAVRARSRKHVSALLTQDGAVVTVNMGTEGPSQTCAVTREFAMVPVHTGQMDRARLYM
ncbi:hypothetical protein ACOMHN_039764 [Nucella lapillus]